MVFTFLENTYNLDISTHVCPLPTENSPPSYYHLTLDRGKLLIPPCSIFFENLFPPTAERGGGSYDLLYQNSIREYEDDMIIYIL